MKDSSRRKFIFGSLFSGLGAFFVMLLYPVWRFIMPPPVPESTQSSVKAANVDELAPNSGKLFPFAGKPALLIRLSDGEYRAFSAVCTHLQCTVQYDRENKLIWCACHNAKFDLNGNIASGPPPAPLESFNVNIRGNEIIVSKKV